MNGLKISEAARETGFTESALRFYEQEGVVVPGRTPTGYRTYDTGTIESLRFVARAKRLGLSLEEITELLALLEEEECQPVQTRMREMVTNRIADAESRIGDLISFASQLQKAAERLGVHTPSGGCDGECGCKYEGVVEQNRATSPITLVDPKAVDISCTLEGGQMVDRLDDWRALLGRAVGREALADGVRVRFPRQVDVSAVSELAASEQECCQFFTFAIGISSDAVTLDVTGPKDAQPVITGLFGVTP